MPYKTILFILYMPDKDYRCFFVKKQVIIFLSLLI